MTVEALEPAGEIWCDLGGNDSRSGG